MDPTPGDNGDSHRSLTGDPGALRAGAHRNNRILPQNPQWPGSAAEHGTGLGGPFAPRDRCSGIPRSAAGPCRGRLFGRGERRKPHPYPNPGRHLAEIGARRAAVPVPARTLLPRGAQRWAVLHPCLAKAVLVPLGRRARCCVPGPTSPADTGLIIEGGVTKRPGWAAVPPPLQILILAPYRVWVPRKISPCGSPLPDRAASPHPSFWSSGSCPLASSWAGSPQGTGAPGRSGVQSPYLALVGVPHTARAAP